MISTTQTTNIYIIDEKTPNLSLDFFNIEYEKIPEMVFQKYNLEE